MARILLVNSMFRGSRFRVQGSGFRVQGSEVQPGRWPEKRPV